MSGTLTKADISMIENNFIHEPDKVLDSLGQMWTVRIRIFNFAILTRD